MGDGMTRRQFGLILALGGGTVYAAKNGLPGRNGSQGTGIILEKYGTTEYGTGVYGQ